MFENIFNGLGKKITNEIFWQEGFDKCLYALFLKHEIKNLQLFVNEITIQPEEINEFILEERDFNSSLSDSLYWEIIESNANAIKHLSSTYWLKSNFVFVIKYSLKNCSYPNWNWFLNSDKDWKQFKKLFKKDLIPNNDYPRNLPTLKNRFNKFVESIRWKIQIWKWNKEDKKEGDKNINIQTNNH